MEPHHKWHDIWSIDRKGPQLWWSGQREGLASLVMSSRLLINFSQFVMPAVDKDDKYTSLQIHTQPNTATSCLMIWCDGGRSGDSHMVWICSTWQSGASQVLRPWAGAYIATQLYCFISSKRLILVFFWYRN